MITDTILLSEFPQVETGGLHGDVVKLPILSEFNEWWSIFSVSILARSASIFCSHSADLKGSPTVDIVNLDPSADKSVQVMHCNNFVGGDLSACTKLQNKQVRDS